MIYVVAYHTSKGKVGMVQTDTADAIEAEYRVRRYLVSQTIEITTMTAVPLMGVPFIAPADEVTP